MSLGDEQAFDEVAEAIAENAPALVRAQVLRPYQQKAVDDVLQIFASPAMLRVLLVLATGGGKTSIAAELVRLEVERGGRVLFVVHRKELADQAYVRFLQFGMRSGVLMGNDAREDRGAEVQVGSVMTLARRRQLDPPPTLVIIDEAHHARANTYQTVLEKYPNARVLGLTATPWREDGRGLGELFHELVIAATPKDLTDLGFLTPITGYVYDRPNLKKVKKSRGDFDEKQLGEVMGEERILGNIVGQYVAHAKGKRGIVFASTVAHSESIAARFRDAGVPAEHLGGATLKEDREAILGRLATGETLIVCNYGVLTEGFDCPAVEVIILARPTISVGLHLQMIGRGLRPSPGKAIARIHDHAGNTFRHGLPSRERDYSLTGDVQSTGSSSSKNDDEDTVDGLMSCPSCFALIPVKSGECSECGHDFNKASEGEGVAIPIELIDAGRRRQRAPTEKRRGPGAERVRMAFLEHLAGVARREARGTSWVRAEFLSRFGEEPSAEAFHKAWSSVVEKAASGGGAA